MNWNREKKENAKLMKGRLSSEERQKLIEEGKSLKGLNCRKGREASGG